MNRSLLRNSAWISLALLISVSCRSPRLLVAGEKTEKISASLASGSFDKMSFKAGIYYKEKELTGQMLIKKIGSDQYKIGFYNEMGMTYFEGSIEVVQSSKGKVQSSKGKVQSSKGKVQSSYTNRGIKVQNIALFLDHPKFIRNLEKSFRMLFIQEHGTFLISPDELKFYQELIMVKLRNGFRLELKLQ